MSRSELIFFLLPLCENVTTSRRISSTGRETYVLYSRFTVMETLLGQAFYDLEQMLLGVAIVKK